MSEKERHLHLLATEILNQARQLPREGEGHGWGLESKRPFGNSGPYQVAKGILDAIDLDYDEELLYEDPDYQQYHYAFELYEEVATYMRKVWEKLEVPQ